MRRDVPGEFYRVIGGCPPGKTGADETAFAGRTRAVRRLRPNPALLSRRCTGTVCRPHPPDRPAAMH
ncbi:hypothetical protein L810_7790 [Burkholderia sp. AU4i]|nr:hypothetical protein L810_7790 [Burkholderia sp. AU4i]